MRIFDEFLRWLMIRFYVIGMWFVLKMIVLMLVICDRIVLIKEYVNLKLFLRFVWELV